MNLESLKYFYMIAKSGNISSVAKEVHLSQSALSQQLQKLEGDLGKGLLIRSNKGVTLTPEGKIVYTFASNILRIYDKMIGELDEVEKGNIVIKIQACPSIANYEFPCTLIQANQVYPKHHYELSGNLSADIITNVSNNICDIGFICQAAIDVGQKNLITNKVGNNRIVLVGNNDESLPDEMPIERLLESCLITFTDKNDITNILLNNLKKKGYDQSQFNCTLRVEGIESTKTLIARQYGIAFLPYSAVKEELYKKQFKIIKVPDFDLNVNIGMVYKANCSKHVQDFINWFSTNGVKSFC